MPITFKNHIDEGYLEITYKGRITDAELLHDYKAFMESDEWIPGLKRFSDLSEADMSGISSGAIKEYAEHINSNIQKHGIHNTKSAIYAPKDIHFGLSRIYETFADRYPVHVQIFRNRDEAFDWLNGEGTE